VSGVAVDEACDDISDDDVVLNADKGDCIIDDGLLYHIDQV